MVRRTTFLVLSMVAVLFLPFADCISPMTQDNGFFSIRECLARCTCDAASTGEYSWGYSAVAASPAGFPDFSRCFRGFRAFAARPLHASLFFPNLTPS